MAAVLSGDRGSSLKAGSTFLRIAALQPSVSIVLDALGCLDALVACTRYCIDAVPALKQRCSDGMVRLIHDSWSASTDEILAARPDLVVASVPYRMESLAAILKAGCAVLAFSPKTLEDIYADMLVLGRVVDRAEATEALIAQMRATIDAVRQRAAQAVTGAATRPLVYSEEWGKPLIQSQPWVQELVEAAGGKAFGTAGAHIEPETVFAADPDVMIFAWCGAGERVPLEKVVAQRGWTKMRAVREGRVYCVNDEWLNTPAPTLLHGLHALAAALHPEVFGEIQTPRAISSSERLSTLLK